MAKKTDMKISTPTKSESTQSPSDSTVLVGDTRRLTRDELIAALGEYGFTDLEKLIDEVPTVQQYRREYERELATERERIASEYVDSLNLEDREYYPSTGIHKREPVPGGSSDATTGFRPNVMNFLSRDETTGVAFRVSKETGNLRPPLVPTPSDLDGKPAPTPTSGSAAPVANTTPAPAPTSTSSGIRAGHGLPTGLSLRPTARPDDYATYESYRVIISRFNRGGSNEKEKSKIRELCTKAITPALTTSNIKKLLTTDDKSYDVSEDAFQGQAGLDNIWKHAVASDFKHILMIPSAFHPHSVNSIPLDATYINCVLEFDKLTDDDYFRWQEFIRLFGQTEEITSDDWFEEKLWKSLSPTLHSEVSCDFRELPDRQKGSISLLRLIINRMIQSGQESRRAMEEYIKHFDICRFPGEDVTEACIRIKAVARSLGTDRLPLDIVHRVLEGFGHASTTEFQTLCASQQSMYSSTLFRSNLCSKSLYTQLVSVLTDLETKFLDLRSGRRWVGLGHGDNSSTSVFLAHDDGGTDDFDDEEASFAVYTAAAGRHAQPYDVWVRDKVCRKCNEVGHLQRHCPRSQGTSKQQLRNHTYRRSPTTTTPPSADMGKQLDLANHKSFVKAILSACQDHLGLTPPKSLLTATSVDTTASVAQANMATEHPVTDHSHSSFFAALGCPKE